jgi:hypothetical protein
MPFLRCPDSRRPRSGSSERRPNSFHRRRHAADLLLISAGFLAHSVWPPTGSPELLPSSADSPPDSAEPPPGSAQARLHSAELPLRSDKMQPGSAEIRPNSVLASLSLVLAG